MDYAINRLGATASTDRLMRENYERGLYEGEEYQYWQKVSDQRQQRHSCAEVGQHQIGCHERSCYYQENLLVMRHTIQSCRIEPVG
jgi:hypothetical protein